MTLPTCEQVREQLPDALAGTLRAEDAHTLFAHVAGCADCRAEAELLQVLRRHAPVTPAGLQARIVAATAARRTPWMLGRGRPALLAAALTGALLGGAVLVHRATTSAPQAAAPAVAVRLQGVSHRRGALYGRRAATGDDRQHPRGGIARHG